MDKRRVGLRVVASVSGVFLLSNSSTARPMQEPEEVVWATEVLAEARESFTSPSLVVGMPAPRLSIVSWSRGVGVDTFEAGEVYVVDLWATWCAPCVEAMPHLSELQERYDEGVRFLGVNVREVDSLTRRPLAGDPRRELVEEFVARHDPDVRFDVGIGAQSVEADWMSASGRASLPSVFVVDRAGRLAWLGGSTAGLEDVLERVLEGRYDFAEAREQQLGEAWVQHLGAYVNEAAVSGDLPRFFELANALAIVAEPREAAYLASLVETVLTHPLLEGKRDLEFGSRGAQLACDLTEWSSAEPIRVAAGAAFATGRIRAAVWRAKLALEAARQERLRARIRSELAGYEAALAQADARRIERVATVIREGMERYRVPGLSLAVIRDFELVWSAGFGVRLAGETDPVTSTTRFQAASISKPIAVTAALVCAERGELDLDRDVNAYLKTWRVPESAQTTKEKVTLRRIATHTAGLNCSGVLGLAPDEPFPALPAVLDGVSVASPRPQPLSPLAEALRVEYVPGSTYAYSGGGLMILQQVLIDVREHAFHETVRRLVFEPLEMEDSTFRQPPSEEYLEACAMGHRDDGTPIDGLYRVYPGAAAAGLWTTPDDLARFVIETMLAADGRSSRVLTPAMTRERLVPLQGPSGMGLFIGEENGVANFNHSGSNAGFKAYLLGIPESGGGVVLMANGDGGWPLIETLVATIAREFAWSEGIETRR